MVFVIGVYGYVVYGGYVCWVVEVVDGCDVGEFVWVVCCLILDVIVV